VRADPGAGRAGEGEACRVGLARAPLELVALARECGEAGLHAPCGAVSVVVMPVPCLSVATLKTSSSYQPTGDQPTAIETLTAGLEAGDRYQTLVGATGTGKTATMAWTIEKIGRPALIIAHNKTLAAQLCNEFREFFPGNAVEYFVSYYDYYQPEAYVPEADL